MGQTIVKLNEKYLTGEDRSSKQEREGMLHDISVLDDTDLDTSAAPDPAELLEACKTPPNVMRLKCDPRSPSHFNRTPLKVPVDEVVANGHN